MPPRHERFRIPEPRPGVTKSSGPETDQHPTAEWRREVPPEPRPDFAQGSPQAPQPHSKPPRGNAPTGRAQPTPARHTMPGRRAAHRAMPAAATAIMASQRFKLLVVAAFTMVTVLVLVDAFRSPVEQNTADSQAAGNAGDHSLARGTGPIPGTEYAPTAIGQLPPGGDVTQQASGRYRIVGTASPRVGEGTQDHYTYVVEVEDTISGTSFGGVDAFAAMVDATLSNPKSWTANPEISFEHVDPATLPEGTEPDLRFQLSTLTTTHEVCGNSYQLETSCYMPIGNRIILNEARWIRGALPFNGDLGGYRQYMINHETGHGIGYASHQACSQDGGLAPIMMQQTLSLNNRQLHDLNPQEVYGTDDKTCLPNPWPYPLGRPDPQAEDVHGVRQES